MVELKERNRCGNMVDLGLVKQFNSAALFSVVLFSNLKFMYQKFDTFSQTKM